jgi:hypothetical protein
VKKSEVVHRLHSLGYLTTLRPKPDAYEKAVKAFQADNSLKPDGVVGPQTVRAFLNPLLGFCGVREHIRTANGLCKWANPKIVWHITGSLKPRISDSDMKDAFYEAFGYWAAVCGVEPSYTGNAKTANVLIATGRIDGNSGTLAWSELPCGNASQLDQMYDTGETFVIKENPSRNEIDLVRVAAHEIGHVIGLPHLSDEGALLAPMYNPNVRRPQKSDIAEGVKRYGPSKSPHPEEPTPGDDGWTEFNIPILGKVKLRSPSRGGGTIEALLE